MDPRAEYLIQILEKIGSPLMASIMTVRGDKPDPQDDAQNMAALLAKTVQVSIDMANATDLSKAGVQDDSVRVALAALASPMVAEQYRLEGKVPADPALKKITSALQAVMTFSENFTPDPENTQRLNDLAAKGKAVDVHQVNIQYIHAFIPVVNAIGAFAFGQSEQKLIMDVSSKLVAKAASLSRSVLGDLSEEEQKLTEVALLRALAEIYAQCHTAETQRLTTMSDEQRAAEPQAPGGGLALDPVWKNFELRVAMLEAMAENTLPAGKSGGSKAPAAPPPAPVESAAPATPPKDIPPPPATPPSAPLEAPENESPASSAPPPAPETPTTAPEQAPPPTEKPSGGNPMSMFAKPKDNAEPPPTTAPEQAPPADPPPAPPPAEAPPETPPAAPEQPPTEPPTPPAESSEKADQDDAKTGGSPMSFFKPPTKNDDEG